MGYFLGIEECKNVSGFWSCLPAHVNQQKDTLTFMSDTLPPVTSENAARPRPVAELVHALKFLTRLPIPFSRTMDAPPLAQSLRMLSVAGALIGLLIAAVLLAGKFLQLPPLLSALLAVSFGLLITGALHEDGLADTFDGLAGGKTRERRLEIMRDSRIGTYGTLALMMAIGLRVTCYAALLPFSSVTVVTVVVACQAFSRALVVDLLWATKSARADGLSAFAGRPSRVVAMFAIIIGLLLTLLAGYYRQFENAILALAFGLAATAIMRRTAIKLIGGQTGDICGATQVICEVVMLVAFVATLR
jgi:adenosylcobinamide-GDP ribazoletransferase